MNPIRQIEPVTISKIRKNAKMVMKHSIWQGGGYAEHSIFWKKSLGVALWKFLILNRESTEKTYVSENDKHVITFGAIVKIRWLHVKNKMLMSNNKLRNNVFHRDEPKLIKWYCVTQISLNTRLISSLIPYLQASFHFC